MRELRLIDIIKKQLYNSRYIGDDCAFLEDLNIFVTQDMLVEEVHFSLNTIKPYLLGRKAVSVNLSDLAAALSKPEYVSVSLSLPKSLSDNFVAELYRGIDEVCREFGVKVTGGDITGSEKVVISICAIGKKVSPYITSRSFAKKGDYIAVSGNFGASGAGFYALSNFLWAEDVLINAHLNPVPRVKEAQILSQIISKNIAVMDCSDGLADALYKIALNSKHSVSVDINKVPVLKETKDFCVRNNLDYKKFVKWGGEDYELLVCVDEETLKNLDLKYFTVIGKVQNKDNTPSVFILDGANEEVISKSVFESNSFNHF